MERSVVLQAVEKHNKEQPNNPQSLNAQHHLEQA